VAYPPPVPPANRTDQTAQFTNHPNDHNQVSGALSDIINVLGSAPQGDAATVHGRFGLLESSTPWFIWGLYSGQTDGNAFCNITWNRAYPDIPASGDVGNRPNCGVLCIGARGPGDIVSTNVGQFAVGAFNSNNALIKVWDGKGVEVKNGYVAFHFLVWGPRYAGQTSAGVKP